MTHNFRISQDGFDSEDWQMSTYLSTRQASEFFPAGHLSVADGDAQAVDPAEEFLLDFDADAAIADCEALWNS